MGSSKGVVLVSNLWNQIVSSELKVMFFSVRYCRTLKSTINAKKAIEGDVWNAPSLAVATPCSGVKYVGCSTDISDTRASDTVAVALFSVEICVCSIQLVHLDTEHDFSRSGVSPNVEKNYRNNFRLLTTYGSQDVLNTKDRKFALQCQCKVGEL